jgi:signal transduction histidine kinase
MTSSEAYIKASADSRSIDELAVITGQFLVEYFDSRSVLILKHCFHPEPFHYVFSNVAGFNIVAWKNEFQNFDLTIFPFRSLEFKNYFYVFNDADYAQSDNYLICSASEWPSAQLEIIRLWFSLMRATTQHVETLRNQLEVDHANLAAQLMHDIQSIINLSHDQQIKSDLQQRLQYQQKLNDNFLFFIRETELLQTRVPIAALIESCLGILNLSARDIALALNHKVDDVTVDVELFARAFNEIIKNALVAVNEDLTKISIHTGLLPSGSPLQRNHWILLTVRDEGPGISGDFLTRITTPFFTTHKSEGSSGFGLTIARKIIEAHMGHLTIKSHHGSGTEVTMYLPIFC